jgi:hypothetical protein
MRTQKEAIEIVAILSLIREKQDTMITIEMNNGSVYRHEARRIDQDFEQYKIWRHNETF